MQPTYRLLQAMLRQNLSVFTAKTVSTISPGTAYLHNWHIDIICRKLKDVMEGKITRLIINNI